MPPAPANSPTLNPSTPQAPTLLTAAPITAASASIKAASGKAASGKAASGNVGSAALPTLPKGRRPSFSSHRNEANATLAVDLLAQVGDAIAGWHQELRQVLADIETVYLAGPIVEGWLEAMTPDHDGHQTDSDSEEASLLRHGDPARLAAYVEQLSRQPAMPPRNTIPSQYRLCSLDADGRLQCHLCPPEQLAVISQGIARHQQLRHLVHRKQDLEAHLQRAAAALTVTRDRLGLPTAPTPCP
ncbi:hypothetical protein [Leptolyngbya sp. PCC 6406]|uniref:hypothetical protein n=1 Tax=Leptolyngbya sp. PCC 6406 TaxID=1173264 RepID=UPI000301E187|nr:hypothetical protein [Leptolyngbya sp. PCC 6406]